MKDGKHLRAEVSRDREPRSSEPVRPLKDVPNSKTAIKTLKILKNCGDCEPGDFGSTYGFGPR